MLRHTTWSSHLLGLLAGSLECFFGLGTEHADTDEPEASNRALLTELAHARAEVKELADLREQPAVLTRHLVLGDEPTPGTDVE